MFCDSVLNDGLLQYDSAFKQGGGADLLFHDLHGKRSDNIAKLLTIGIRKYIPDDIQKHYSSRSLRMGATTTLRIARDISHSEEIGRSGHASGDNSDRYIDRNNPWNSLPGGLCLAGFNDCHGKPISPSIQIVATLDGTDLVMNLFIDKLIKLNAHHESFFGKKGTLRPIVEQFVASGIMYFNDIRSQTGASANPHALIQKMVTVSDDMFGIEGLSKLIKRSKAVKDDYILRSKETILETSSIMMELQELRGEMASLKNVLNHMDEVKSALHHHNILNSPLSTPQRALVVQRTAASNTPADGTTMQDNNSTSTSTTSKCNSSRTVLGNNSFEKIIAGSKRTAGRLGRNIQNPSMTIADAIVYFHSKKLFKEKTVKADIGNWMIEGVDIRSKAKVTKCLQLVAILMLDEQFGRLKRLEPDSATLKQCAREIEMTVMNQYKDLFGLDKSNKVKSKILQMTVKELVKHLSEKKIKLGSRDVIEIGSHDEMSVE